MLWNTKRKFLFRCEDCEMIIAVDFDDPADFDKIQEDKLHLECPCEGLCHLLRD